MDKTTANFFYEQCAGATSGHMGMIPNNPVLWALFSAHTGRADNHHAATPEQFAEFLRQAANVIDPL